MISDADRLPLLRARRCDVCVVGAGPAGIVAALEIAERGGRVCLLEAGGLDPDPLGQIRSMHPYTPHVAGRVAGLGGTSSVWAGRCRALDERDFREQPWIADSGWPIDSAELSPFFRRARQWLRLERTAAEAAAWERDVARTRSFDPAALRVGLLERRLLDFGLTYRERLRACPGLEVLVNAEVRRLETVGSRIDRAIIATPGGRSAVVRAGAFVLAGGGLEIPRLMLESGGLGNAHDLVGRYFMDHPYANAAVVTPSDESALESIIARGHGDHGLVRLTDDVLDNERLVQCAAFLGPRVPHIEHPSFDSHGVVAARALLAARRRRRRRDMGRLVGRSVSGWRDIARAATGKLRDAVRPSGQYWLRTVIEAAPCRDNRVFFDQGVMDVRWRHSAIDVRSHRRFVEILLQEITGHGAATVDVVIDLDAPIFEGGKHHMGTTRMHDDPTRGVVDRDCRVHGIDNLFVASSSVFPTYGYANPTMTILALAIRVADHVADR